MIAKILRDRRGQQRGAQAHERRLVRCRHDDDRAREARGTEIFLDELAQFAAAFADERDDIQVALRAARHHAEQRRFSHAAAREDADALALADGREDIDRADAGGKTLANPLAAQRVRRRAAERLHRLRFDGAVLVDRLAEPVDHASEHRRPDRHRHQPRSRHDRTARADVVHFAERHEQDSMTAKADDLRIHRRLVGRRANLADFAERGVRPVRLDDEARHLRDATDSLDRSRGPQPPAE